MKADHGETGRDMMGRPRHKVLEVLYVSQLKYDLLCCYLFIEFLLGETPDDGREQGNC